MIDEKKIKEAQEEIFEDKFHFNGEYVMMSEGDSEPHRVEMYDDGQIKEAFKAGANWAIDEFLKDLWHDASEEPDYLGRRILYEYKSNGVINPSTRIKEASLPEKLHWKEFSYKPINPERIITRWLYIDDLLKGGSDV